MISNANEMTGFFEIKASLLFVELCVSIDFERKYGEIFHADMKYGK